MVLPGEDGAFRLTWLSHARIDGDVIAAVPRRGDRRRGPSLQRAAAPGGGRHRDGVLGDRKKLSTRQLSATFFADDTLRPPSRDLRHEGQLRARPRPCCLRTAGVGDIATDTDNTWTDGAVVDAHADVGFTYDYYFARFNRRGVDGNNRPMRAIVHAANRADLVTLPGGIVDEFLLNAFWCPVCGEPDNQGFLLFGEGLPAGFTLGGQNVDFFAAGFDIVAHELQPCGDQLHVQSGLPE